MESSSNQPLIGTGMSVPIQTTNASTTETKYKLHEAAYEGRKNDVERLLKAENANVLETDETRSTPLHCVAYSNIGSKWFKKIAEMLLNHNKERRKELLNMQDSKGNTAVHLAAKYKHLQVLAVMLKEEMNPNLQLENEDGYTPIFCLADCKAIGKLENAVKLMEKMLKRKDNTISDWTCVKTGETLLHYTAKTKATKMVEYFLTTEQGKAGVEVFNKKGFTPLHVAVLAGNCEDAVACVTAIMNATPDVNIKTVDKEEKLSGMNSAHLAVLRGHDKILSTLLDNTKVNLWARTSQGLTLIHLAVDNWLNPNAEAILTILLESKKLDMSLKYRQRNDSIGQELVKEKAKKVSTNRKCHCLTETPTALHLAAHNGAVNMVNLLLSKPKLETILEMIRSDKCTLIQLYRSIPETILIGLYQCVWLESHDGRDFVLKIDFSFVTADLNLNANSDSKDEDTQIETGAGVSESEVPIVQETLYLYSVLEAPYDVQKELLADPIVQVYIEEKWSRAKLFVYLGLLFQCYLVGIFSLFIYTTRSPKIGHMNETSNSGRNDGNGASNLLDVGERGEAEDIGVYFLGSLLFLSSAALVLKEIVKIISEPNIYCINPFNWMKICIGISGVGLSSYFFVTSIPCASPMILAGTIFVVWGSVIHDLGQLPNCGPYSEIIYMVTVHLAKMLLFFMPLVLAFSFAFEILVAKNEDFQFPFGFVNILLMMTSGVERDDLTPAESTPQWSIQIAIFLFIMFIAIVLLNLLTALAVSDVKELLTEAETSHVQRKLKQIFMLETFLVNLANQKLLKTLSTKLLTHLSISKSVRWENGKYYAKTSDFHVQLRNSLRRFIMAKQNQ